jgi:hypothetical protein
MSYGIEFAAADRDFYAPLWDARDDGEVFAPRAVPEQWHGTASGLWTVWHRPGHADLVDEGWKVHVSARPDRLVPVLDRVAAVCFAQRIPFKHLTTRCFYQWTHHKYAARPQSGKFIAAYPPHVDAARQLMERLRDELAGEEGPYILTDRRFEDSRTVYYRYGSFRPRSRVEADGTSTHLVRVHDGRLVPDTRGVAFSVPAGVVDPFTRRGSGAVGSSRLGGYTVDSSVRYTNAGGAYRGHEVATGRRVFIKEGRPHTGLREDGATACEQLREEWDVLTALHALAPGLAPEPISYFRAWEHEFMATEHVDGMLLSRWVAVNLPVLRAGATAADFAAYYDRCRIILSGLESALARLRAVGYLFIDVSPGNVLVDERDAVRLIDFGSAHRLGGPFVRAGTPGFLPPERLVAGDLAVYDDYGLSRIALHLLGPLNLVVDRNPAVLAHMHHDLSELAPVPPALWQRATKYQPPSDRPPADLPPYPAPDEVAADPVRYLTQLRDQALDALVAVADVDHPTRVFPTVAQGYLCNTTCVAYGTAGVVHALRRAGRPLPDGLLDRLLDRLRRDALDDTAALGPGLFVGRAGIARVLADCGLVDEARTVLAEADRGRLTATNATLFGGSAGVALTHLAMYGHTRDEHHVDRARALADALPCDEEMAARLGPDDAVGLMHGRCGVALMLAQLGALTGEDGYLGRAVRLLHAELDRAIDPAAAGLLFPISATDRRAVPYLFAGSAGMVFATVRCLRAIDDERLATALPRLLAPLRLTYTVMPGLCQGLAGYAFTLADHAALTGADVSRAASVRAARSLFKFAVPHPTGVRFLGDQLLRFSTELWSGSAGVVLALTQVLDPRPDALFTADAVIARQDAGPAATPASRLATVG